MDIARDPLGRRPRRAVQVVGRLEIHPELRRAAEVAGQPQRRVGRDGPPAVHDLAHPRHRHAQVSRHAIDAEPERLHQKELGADDLAEQLSLARAQAEYPGVFVDGGPGDDIATAFVVRGAPTGSVGVEAEYRHLAGLFGVRGEDWDPEFQSLHENGVARYDLLAIILKDGSRKQVYFDITDFFAKPG